MDPGTTSDQNFYSRSKLSQSSPDTHHEGSDITFTPPSDHQDISGHLPNLDFVKSNIQATSTNGYAIGATASLGDSPDEFYKGFHEESYSNGDAVCENMPRSRSPSGQAHGIPSSLRSNSNGTTPKYPAIAGFRSIPKSSYRSASAPVNETSTLGLTKPTLTLKGVPRGQQPSVKDLLSRFDQNGDHPSSLSRTPTNRLRNNSPDISGRYKPSTSTENQQTNGKPGQTTTGQDRGRAKSPATSKTQQNRFATENQHSNNTLSPVPRSTKPLNRFTGNANPSGSMVNLDTPGASPKAPQKTISPNTDRVPLFGEVISNESGSQLAFGISEPRGRTRRTSDSNLLSQSWSHRRSHSDLNVSPSSPTAWYLGATPKLADVDINATPKPLKSHNRSRSDLGGRRINPNEASGLDGLVKSRPPEAIWAKVPSKSRLPISSRKTSLSSTSSSPGSTRSSSPFASKMNASNNSKSRKPDPRPWSHPTNGSSSRLSGRGQVRSPGKVLTSNASLKAYISSPPPMKSPPLRSSRPRQTVSAATTASSRNKLSDINRLSQSRNISRTESGIQEQERISRLESAGPVDYAAKRARIQQAFSKTIQETEQKELEQKELEQRELEQKEREQKELQQKELQRKELQQKELEGNSLEQQDLEQQDLERKDSERKDLVQKEFDEKEFDQNESHEVKQWEETHTWPSEAVAHRMHDVAEPKLVVDTSFHSPSNRKLSTQQHLNDETVDLDSPTLGMPQCDSDVPTSALSSGTVVTLFDNEPQTELSKYHSGTDFSQAKPPSQSGSFPPDPDGVSEDPFYAQDGHESIQIILDAVLNDESRYPSRHGGHHEMPIENQHNSLDEEDTTFTNAEFISSVQDAETTSFIRSSSSDSAFESHRAIKDHHFEYTTALPGSQVNGPTNYILTEPINDKAMPANAVSAGPTTSWPHPHVSPNHSSLDELPKINTSRDIGKETAPTEFSGSPLTEMDYESSENMEERFHTSYVDTSGTEPSIQRIEPRRGSHTSSWTQFTVEENDRSSWQSNVTHVSKHYHEPWEAPPPPPKEPIVSEKPEVPPKPASYTPHLPPRSNGDFGPTAAHSHSSELCSSTAELNEINPSGRSSRNNSTIPPIPATPSWLTDSTSPPIIQSQIDSMLSTTRKSPPLSNAWNRQPPPSLHRYSFKDSESRRVSGDEMYSYRPSTSTARSSAQISLEYDVTETPLSSNEQFSIDATQHNTDGVNSEADLTTLRHRRMLIQELIDTEAVYLKDMNVVVEIYQGTAEACPKLGNGDIKTIFRNSEEVISFSESFLADIKAASTSIYIPRSSKSKHARNTKIPELPEKTERPSSTADDESDWTKDQRTTIGANFSRHIEEMERVYADFLKNSEQATNRLQSLQIDPTVKVWLEECNAVAKDLSGAWDLDALLVKPVQRITRYQLLLTGIVKHTPQSHPDHIALKGALDDIKLLLDNIDGQKKRIHKVNEIVAGRKRKESDIRSGLKNPFTRREKVDTAILHDRDNEDQVYLKYCDKFHSEWIHLQFIIRDIDLYIENVALWVEDFLRYLSAIELVVRASPSSFPELESKWARFNLSMRDMGKVALEQHIYSVRKEVLDPFSQLIKLYIPPQAALKKRNKRRPDFQRFQHLKSQNRKIDEKLADQVEQYTALNDTLKLELPKLSALNEKLKNICLAGLITIQAGWYSIWNEKLRTVLEQNELPKDIEDILDKFTRDFKHQDAKAQSMSILNGTLMSSARGRLSLSTATTKDDDTSMKSKSRTSTLNDRSRGRSVHSDNHSSLASPDPAQKNSGQSHFSPTANSSGLSLPQLNKRDVSPSVRQFYEGADSLSAAHPPYRGRPDTRLSFESGGVPRPSAESTNSGWSPAEASYDPGRWVDGLPPPEPSFSDVFNSALPWRNGTDDGRLGDWRSSQRQSDNVRFSISGHRVLFVVASLNEFNIEGTKMEAGYPYLKYQEGEIFDVVGEKGELWLAKNQDDPTHTVGWIWNQHFARMVEY